MKPEKKAKHMDKKWKAQEKLGLKRPKNPEENQQRIREAHIGN